MKKIGLIILFVLLAFSCKNSIDNKISKKGYGVISFTSSARTVQENFNVETFREPFTVLKRNGVKNMYEACDMDKTVNENVAKGVKKLNDLIKEFKFSTKSMRWKWDKDDPEVNKGIDDMLLSQKKENM